MGGETLTGGTREELDLYLRAEITKWAKAVKGWGATANRSRRPMDIKEHFR